MTTELANSCREAFNEIWPAVGPTLVLAAFIVIVIQLRILWSACRRKGDR